MIVYNNFDKFFWDRQNERLVKWSTFYNEYFDGLVQEGCNSIVNALELRLCPTNPSIYSNNHQI